MLLQPTLLLAALATVAQAWLPADKLLNHDNSTISKRWLPANGKIRGVNLGSLFIIEPWMANDAWNAMGCGGKNSEFDCMMALGQAKGDAAFQSHWNSWITQNDLQQMVNLGLNTIRIPVGYWMREDIVWRDSEWFPKGGFPYLQRICNDAANLGMYIIMDLHGGPGAQVAKNSFTGQVSTLSNPFLIINTLTSPSSSPTLLVST
jgi:aryl-phospho-beta-D-glucosidase BglC (GH1 family)